MRYWIAVFLLTLVCFQGVYAGDDIGGSAHLTYFSTKTKTGEEEDRSWSFSQTYNLKASKAFSPKVSFAANVGINVQETNEQKTTRLTPDLRLNVTNEYFNANTGYQITEKGLDVLTMVTDEQRYTTESRNANLSTKSDKYPKVRLRYNEDRGYDHLTVHEKNTKTTNFSGAVDYNYRFLNFNYGHQNNISDDYVTDKVQETGTNYGKIDFRKSFWANKITSSGSYSINDTNTETKTGGQDVRAAEKKTASKGLYKKETAPTTVELESKPALIDGNKKDSAGINIGESENTCQNIGIDLTSATEVELIYLYTTTPSTSFNKNFFTWAVYYSSDNLSWTQISGKVSKDYDTSENRFEISFTATTARYFKVVNTANQDFYPLYVSEIEAYSYTTYSAFSTTKTERTTQTVLANLGYKPADWLSLIYDFTQTGQDTKTDTTRRQTHNMNVRAEKELHKYITAWAQYGRRMEYDSAAATEDKTTDTYLMHFLSSPLTTLDTNFSLNHTVSKKGGETESRNSSALFRIAAKLREGADLDIDGNVIRS
ncbi:MAG: discoidin domain-containing protein, partial [Spirochaetales bacterium]|nr:discoidin domain-containing protein [Spirochaetales bacterium]